MTTLTKSGTLSFDVDRFCEISGLRRTFVFCEIKSGRLRARKAGRRTVILEEDAIDYLRRLPTADAAA